jgi:hypothetical protein
MPPNDSLIRSRKDLIMSRSGYTDDCDDNWSVIMWRGAVASAIGGRRGQTFLREMLTALDALPVKRLVADKLAGPDLVPCSHWGLYETESVCAIGAVGKARGIDMHDLDPHDRDTVAAKFGIATAMAQEIVYINDEMGRRRETPEERFVRVREWVESEIKTASPDEPRKTA